MTFLPVAQRELLAASRRRATFRVRGAAGILAVVVGFFGLLVNVGGRNAGAPIFYFLAYLAAFISAVSALVLTADAVAAERREGTLGLLFLTDLSALDVLAGKLVAATAGAATALFAAFPVMAVGMILGGVTGGEFWRHLLALLNLLWVAGTLGLLCSVSSREAGRALFHGVVALVLLTAGLGWAAELMRRGTPGIGSGWLLSLNPGECLNYAAAGPYAGRPEQFWRSLGTAHLLGWGLLAVAAVRLPRVWRNDADGNREHREAAGRGLRRVGHLENPVAALNRASGRERALVWTVAGITVAVGLGLVLARQPLPTFPLWGAPVFSPAFLLLKCVFAWRCCAFFQGLRQGAGELLLTTPVRPMQVVGGGWAGARALVQPPLTVLVAAYGILSLISGMATGSGLLDSVTSGLSHLLTPAYVVGCLALDLVALAWLSLRFGTRAGSPASAFGKSIGVLLLPRVLFCVPDLLISGVVLAWARGPFREAVGSRPEPIAGLRAALRGG